MILANSFSFLFFALFFFAKEYCKQNPLIFVLIVSQISPLSSLSVYSALVSSIISLILALNSESSNKLALNFQKPGPLLL